MKIAYITPGYYPEIGGGELHSFFLSKSLSELGHEVVVFTRASSVVSHEFITKNLRIQYLKAIGKTQQCLLPPMRNKILKFNPSVIFCHGPCLIADQATFLAKIYDIPLIEWYIGDIIKTSPVKDFLARIYCNFHCLFSLKNARTIIVSNRLYVKILTQRGIPRQKISVIHPGIDSKWLPTLTKKRQIKKTLSLKNQKIVLFVGRLGVDAKQKGLDVIIGAIPKILNKISNVLFVFIGGGALLSKYQQICTRKNFAKNILFTGIISKKKLAQFYTAADCLILPSISRTEAFGLVLLEAMSFGCPVITTSIVGGAEVVSELQAGIIISPKNSDQLATAIITILQNKQLALKFRQNGKKVIETNSWTKVADQIQKLIS